MAKYKPTREDDEPPLSGVRGRDQQAIDRICAILAARFEIPAHAVQLKSRFIEDLKIDVFDLPDLILALEEAFDVNISIGLAARILTVQDALACVLLIRAETER